MKTMNWQLWR